MANTTAISIRLKQFETAQFMTKNQRQEITY